MYVARMAVFEEKELISNRASWILIDLDKIRELTNEDPKVGPNIQFEIERATEEIDIFPHLPYRYDRGHHMPSYIRVYIIGVNESLVWRN